MSEALWIENGGGVRAGRPQESEGLRDGVQLTQELEGQLGLLGCCVCSWCWQGPAATGAEKEAAGLGGSLRRPWGESEVRGVKGTESGWGGGPGKLLWGHGER